MGEHEATRFRRAWRYDYWWSTGARLLFGIIGFILIALDWATTDDEHAPDIAIRFGQTAFVLGVVGTIAAGVAVHLIGGSGLLTALIAYLVIGVGVNLVWWIKAGFTFFA